MVDRSLREFKFLTRLLDLQMHTSGSAILESRVPLSMDERHGLLGENILRLGLLNLHDRLAMVLMQGQVEHSLQSI